MSDIKNFLEDLFGKPEKVDKLKQKAKDSVLSEFKEAAKQVAAGSIKTILERNSAPSGKQVSDMPEGDDPQKLTDELLGSKIPIGQEPYFDKVLKDDRLARLEAELEELREAQARVDGQLR